MADLVEQLSNGEHPVTLILRPQQSAKALKDAIDRGYVHIKFTETRGGTELGFHLQRDFSQLNADFDKGIGTIRVQGPLMLNYQKVVCVAEIDIASYSGKGHLIRL